MIIKYLHTYLRNVGLPPAACAEPHDSSPLCFLPYVLSFCKLIFKFWLLMYPKLDHPGQTRGQTARAMISFGGTVATFGCGESLSFRAVILKVQSWPSSSWEPVQTVTLKPCPGPTDADSLGKAGQPVRISPHSGDPDACCSLKTTDSHTSMEETMPVLSLCCQGGRFSQGSEAQGHLWHGAISASSCTRATCIGVPAPL